MSKRKQMSVAVKSSIVTLKSENYSIRAIASRVGFNESCVRRFLKKYNTTGSLERKKGSGPKRKTSKKDDHNLKFAVLRNRTLSAANLKSELKNTGYANLSVRTVQRRLNELGFMSRKPAKKPFLNEKMKQNRFHWCQEHKNWSLNDWSRVIFSDESRFNLFGQDGKQNIRRRKGEKFNADCIQSTVKHSPYVMVWGCITPYGVGSLQLVEGMMNAKGYKEVIRNHVLRVVEDLTQYTEDPIFQDDSAPCHRAISITDLKEHLGIKSLSWPGNSPDLNPIENLWAFIGKNLRENKPKTVNELKNCIVRIWENEISVDVIRNLYKSMPRRINAVIKAKGGPTKY